MPSWLDTVVLQDSSRPKISRKPWMEEVKFELATADNLERIFEHCMDVPKVAVDTETEGLDLRVFDPAVGTQHKLVGICLAPDAHTGYYLPLRHAKGASSNLPFERVRPLAQRLFREKVCIFHNSWYDQEILEYPGGDPLGSWNDHKSFEDTQILAYLSNSKSRETGLKYLSKTHLRSTAGDPLEMIELRELFPADHVGDLDFKMLDPTWDPTVWYAASDAICTFRLEQFFQPIVVRKKGDPDTQRIAYSLEKMCVPATRWMQRCRIHIDQERVSYLIKIGQIEYKEAIESLYEQCSRILGRNIRPGWVSIFLHNFVADDPTFDVREQINEAKKTAQRERIDPLVGGKFITHKTSHGTFPVLYDLLSRPQVGKMLEEIQIPDLRHTENSGQVQTRDAEIERLAKRYGDKYPFLPLISRIGELQKALGTYLLSLQKDVAHDGTISVRFKQLGTDTGRFTTPKPQDPKASGGTSFPFHGTPAGYDTERPECLLRVRETFSVRSPEYIFAAIDFAGVELRIATNLAGEPNWIKEYFRCSTCGHEFARPKPGTFPAAPPPYCPSCGDDRIGDLHTNTALSFYGEDGPEKYGKKVWKNKRQEGKRSNFLLIYGGSANRLKDAIPGATSEDCYRYHQNFTESNPYIVRWWDTTRKFARAKNYVTTVFGRHYPVSEINLPRYGKGVDTELNRKLQNKAERNATNAPIQGASADITKLAMAFVYKMVMERGWMGKIYMIGTIHDELLFEVHKSIAAEALPLIQEQMTRNKLVEAVCYRRQKWLVPLTTDCEIGRDWSAPYDLKNFTSRRVRRDGVEVDEKGRPTKKVWPKEYVEIFGPAYGYADDTSPVQVESPPLPSQPSTSPPETPPPAPTTTATTLVLKSTGLRMREVNLLAEDVFRAESTSPDACPLTFYLDERLVHLPVEVRVIKERLEESLKGWDGRVQLLCQSE